MNDFSKRVNSIVVKNLPKDFTANQLEELFSECGHVVSSKVLPQNPSFEGGYGFVNFNDVESCNQAVEQMNNFVIGDFTIRVSHSMSRPGYNNSDRPQNGVRAFGETNGRTLSATSVNTDETNGISSPGTQTRFNNFRPASERSPSATQSKPISFNGTSSNTNEWDTVSNSNKPLWNNNSGPSKSPFQNGTSLTIQEHEPFVANTTYNVYLSNLEVPNIIFTATLDDYVNATLLITQMNKHEQLTKVQANSYKSKLVVGQTCAALFSNDWYRARVLEVGDNRVRVQYIDWGNTGWCDSTLEIRPLPNEYYKDPVLCVKCILDGIPSHENLTEEQTNAILGILVLDLKLEMTVLRIENGLSYVRLNLGERNLNNEIRRMLVSSPGIKPNQTLSLHSNQPEVNLSDIHYVQLTTVDQESECFHVLLMRDCLATIMNVLKDWNVNKQPLSTAPKSNMLVCAQYDADDLWYRAWIKSVTENNFRVYFVDFGNEEVVSSDRLSECPDNLKSVPWQSVQIKLANIKLTDDERYALLRDFETERLEMKIIQKNQDIYLVDLLTNGKSLIDHVLELRKKQPVQEAPRVPVQPIPPPVTKTPVSVPRTVNEVSRPIASSIVDTSKQPTVTNSNKTFQQLSVNDQNHDVMNDNLTLLITEQRRQNRLLEQVIAAINTTNSLLTQLVQR